MTNTETLRALVDAVEAARSHLGAIRPDSRLYPEDAAQWDALTRVAALLSAGDGVAEGFVVVPRELTEDMENAWFGAPRTHDEKGKPNFQAAYSAMLAAAPAAPVAGCHVCGGDCAGANPPMLNCPHSDYSNCCDTPAYCSSVRRCTAKDDLPPAYRLHPATEDLVRRFSAALAEKLAAAELKYGYSDGWAESDWMDECRAKLLEHVAKGDPRDVAAYCAFLWHHGERTAAAPAVGVDEARQYVQVGEVFVDKYRNGEWMLGWTVEDPDDYPPGTPVFALTAALGREGGGNG